MDEFLEEEGKLGHGFMSADLLKEIDIGDGDRPRPTFISANLDPKYKQELKSLLRVYKDCYSEKSRTDATHRASQRRRQSIWLSSGLLSRSRMRLLVGVHISGAPSAEAYGIRALSSRAVPRQVQAPCKRGPGG